MSKLLPMREAIRDLVPSGASVCMNCQMEQMIPFAASHEIIRQKKPDLTLIGPISDILFDQLIGAGCVERVIAAWVGNVMMGSAYNVRRAVEQHGLKVTNMTNFTVALALQAAAMGVPYLPTRSALGSDVAKANDFFAEITSPFPDVPRPPSAGNPPSARQEKLHAVKALTPDVTIVHVQRADRYGNSHCWANFGIMQEAVRAAKTVIVTAEEIVEPEVIASDPNRTVVPGFLVSGVVEAPFGAHPSPVQGYYRRDDRYFEDYHSDTKTPEDFAHWAEHWVHGVADVHEYAARLGGERAQALRVKQHAYAAAADFGY